MYILGWRGLKKLHIWVGEMEWSKHLQHSELCFYLLFSAEQWLLYNSPNTKIFELPVLLYCGNISWLKSKLRLWIYRWLVCSVFLGPHSVVAEINTGCNLKLEGGLFNELVRTILNLLTGVQWHTVAMSAFYVRFQEYLEPLIQYNIFKIKNHINSKRGRSLSK